MKRSILEKRAQDSNSLDEYSDISSNKHNNKLNKLISNAADMLASLLSTALLFVLILQSLRSVSLSRSYTPAQQAKKQKKSSLHNKFKLVLDALVTSISKFGEIDKRATNKRLSKIKAKIKEGQVELKAISSKMLVLLKLIAQKQ